LQFPEEVTLWEATEILVTNKLHLNVTAPIPLGAFGARHVFVRFYGVPVHVWFDLVKSGRLMLLRVELTSAKIFLLASTSSLTRL
jgi:hypothetical protein